MLEKVKRSEFLPPRQINSHVDRALDAIVRKAMSLRPEDRYQSPLEIAADLNRWLADQPVSAHAEPLPAKAMRWVRRRKQWVAAAAFVVLLGSIGLAMHDWQLGREQVRTKRALEQASERLLTTRKALRQQYDLAANGLAAFPKSESLREKQTRSVLQSYLDLRESYPDDSDLCFETADVYRILGGILRITGRFSEAEICLGQSISLFAQLVDRGHETAQSMRMLVSGRNDRGEVHRMNGKSRLAEMDYDAAIELIERLEHSLKPADFASRKASALINRSELRVLRGQYQEAKVDAEQSVALLEFSIQQTESPSTRDELRWLLAMALTDRGIAIAETATTKTGEADFRRALEVAKEVPADSLYFEDMRWQNAVTLSRLGGFLGSDVTRRTESEQRFNESAQIFQQLIKDSRDLPFYREELSIALMGRARMRLHLGALKLAEQDWISAAAIIDGLRRQFPSCPQYLSLQSSATALAADVRAREGRNDESRRLMSDAAELVEQAIQLDPDRELDRRSLANLRSEMK